MSVEEPTVWIGKGGTAQQTVEEVSRQLEKRKVVKVRVLRSAAEGDTRQLAERVSEATGAELIDVRGRTFVLYRPRREKG